MPIIDILDATSTPPVYHRHDRSSTTRVDHGDGTLVGAQLTLSSLHGTTHLLNHQLKATTFPVVSLTSGFLNSKVTFSCSFLHWHTSICLPSVIQQLSFCWYYKTLQYYIFYGVHSKSLFNIFYTVIVIQGDYD